VFLDKDRMVNNVQKHNICSVLTNKGVLQVSVIVEMVLTVPPHSLVSADYRILGQIKRITVYFLGRPRTYVMNII
jgi:hypothetical protein